jgi:hypothetical protein
MAPVTAPEAGNRGRGHRGQLGLQTWTTYRDYIANRVVPIIGSVPLQKVTGETLDALYDRLEEEGGRNRQGLAVKTIVNVHGLLHKAFADATRRGKLMSNPADATEAPNADRPGHQVWAVEQLRAFLEHVRGGPALRGVAAVRDDRHEAG